MIKRNWKVYVFWIAVTQAVGILSGFLSRDANQMFQQTAMQPPLSPPALVFPIVWSILYVLMGISAARIWRCSGLFR